MIFDRMFRAIGVHKIDVSDILISLRPFECQIRALQRRRMRLDKGRIKPPATHLEIGICKLEILDVPFLTTNPTSLSSATSIAKALSVSVLLQMEAMRRRFAAPRDLKHLNQGPHFMKVKSHPVQQQLTPHNSANLDMRLSIDTSLVLSDNTVTLYCSKPDTVANISTTSDPDAKIWTLESMNDFIRRSGRPDLDALREFPIAKRIIETFESKGVCLDALQLFLSNEENREPIVGWITEIWGEGEDNDPNKETDSIPESPGGSLFSDSDAPDMVVPHRVRPITLRKTNTGSYIGDQI